MPRLSLRDRALGQLKAGRHADALLLILGVTCLRFIVCWSVVVLQETLVTVGLADDRG